MRERSRQVRLSLLPRKLSRCDQQGLASRLPNFVLGNELRRGCLVPILAYRAERRIGIRAVALPSIALSPKVRLFTQFRAQHFGSTPPWEASSTPSFG